MLSSKNVTQEVDRLFIIICNKEVASNVRVSNFVGNVWEFVVAPSLGEEARMVMQDNQYKQTIL